MKKPIFRFRLYKSLTCIQIIKQRTEKHCQSTLSSVNRKRNTVEDLRKVDSLQLFYFWRTLAICLASLITMFMLTKVFPAMLSPIFALACALVAYNEVKKCQNRYYTCAIVPYAIFLSLIVYSFATIVLNILDAWKLIEVPTEIVFFHGPYIPSLTYLPIGALTMIYIVIRQRKLPMCKYCNYVNSDAINGNKISGIFNHEAHVQLYNLTILFSALSILVWVYFLVFYVNVNQNARDWYIFIWTVVVVFVLDEIYFVTRYYNLYLDLKEANEVITPEELQDLTAKTYLRFYVICRNYLYCDPKMPSPGSKYGEIIDTPFFTKRNMNGISAEFVDKIIHRMTGVDGELRFFYGRKTGLKEHTLLRYFYFVKEHEGVCPVLKANGEWIDFNIIKEIYSKDPGRMSHLEINDITRLSTIILTQKLYNDKGVRRSGIKSYVPTFDLIDVYKSPLDFQDDKWIRISMFNSDVPMFRLRRWWRRLIGRTVAGAD